MTGAHKAHSASRKLLLPSLSFQPVVLGPPANLGAEGSQAPGPLELTLTLTSKDQTSLPEAMCVCPQGSGCGKAETHTVPLPQEDIITQACSYLLNSYKTQSQSFLRPRENSINIYLPTGYSRDSMLSSDAAIPTLPGVLHPSP